MKRFVTIFLFVFISSCHLYDPVDDLTMLDDVTPPAHLYYFDTRSKTEKVEDQFLRISLPSAHFFVLKESDRKFLYAAIQHSLEKMALGKKSYWENRSTKVYGYVTPVETFNAPSGMTCRQFKNEIVAQGGRLLSAGLACRSDSPKWQAVEK